MVACRVAYSSRLRKRFRAGRCAYLAGEGDERLVAIVCARGLALVGQPATQILGCHVCRLLITDASTDSFRPGRIVTEVFVVGHLHRSIIPQVADCAPLALRRSGCLIPAMASALRLP